MEWVNKYPTQKPKLLTANDKVIKLYKIDIKREKKFESCKRLL